MNLLRHVLLLVVALGLQVPGGLTLELCLCRGLGELLHHHGGPGTSQGCCAGNRDDSGRADESGPDRCCHAAPQSTEDACCGCFKLTTPEQPHAISLLPSIDIARLDAPPVGVPPLVHEPCEVAIVMADRGREPPGARTSLPLLL